MAENGSSQENEGAVTRKESHQDPLWIETQGSKAANKVRVDELQGTTMDLMQKAWESLPSLKGARVRPRIIQGTKVLTSPSRDDCPLLPCVGREGISNYYIHVSPGNVTPLPLFWMWRRATCGPMTTNGLGIARAVVFLYMGVAWNASVGQWLEAGPELSASAAV